MQTNYACELRSEVFNRVSISKLKENAKKLQEEEKRRFREANEEVIRARKTVAVEPSSASRPEVAATPRKDSSPVKPLGSILNLPRILSVNASQVSALWTAYHASRSEGTGRGYLCASIPLEAYERMAAVATRYPTFVLPVPRPDPEAKGNANTTETPYEFQFMQWAFHESPPIPSAAEPDPFVPSTNTYQAADGSSNPPTSSILFTPLQEFKMRNSFATPYLVLTHYTDLARTHGIVLLRGEITPGSGNDGRYLLSQEDAQILSMGVQKFYLWSDNKGVEQKDGSTGESILRTFHEKPSEFDWQEMLKYSTQL
ncbi:ATP11 protein-domain-containing protein [Lentinula edodes]|uniref:ATP11 protein-domain-containing protein n=1 Tax=Lentinula edodes TaxID=5353 RepID=UPI001E8DA828|nr:ATP11 protein-domain-containing protein [Lentinula edodes]KAH7881234.1 ATP11 protein-domain-containing protein [Lentinula edodes]